MKFLTISLALIVLIFLFLSTGVIKSAEKTEWDQYDISNRWFDIGCFDLFNKFKMSCILSYLSFKK